MTTSQLTFIYNNIHTIHTQIDVTFAQLSSLKKKILVQMLIDSEMLFLYNLKWKNNNISTTLGFGKGILQ